jgi:hypothetical protein
MQGMMGGMMWGMGLLWILAIVVLVLLAAALVRYLFFSKPRRLSMCERDHRGIDSGALASECANSPTCKFEGGAEGIGGATSSNCLPALLDVRRLYVRPLGMLF